MTVKCEVRDCDNLSVDFIEIGDDDGWNLCQFHYDFVEAFGWHTFQEQIPMGTMSKIGSLMEGVLGLRQHTDQELEEGITLRGQRLVSTRSGLGAGC